MVAFVRKALLTLTRLSFTPACHLDESSVGVRVNLLTGLEKQESVEPAQRRKTGYSQHILAEGAVWRQNAFTMACRPGSHYKMEGSLGTCTATESVIVLVWYQTGC